MSTKSFENVINEAWNNKGQVNSKSSRKLLNSISKTIDLLDVWKNYGLQKKKLKNGLLIIGLKKQFYLVLESIK